MILGNSSPFEAHLNLRIAIPRHKPDAAPATRASLPVREHTMPVLESH